MSGRRRGRSVPMLYGVLSLVLVAGALTYALTAPPPSTPPLAEVAPAPQEQVEVERVEQSSRFGEGAGGEGECVAGDPGCEGSGEQQVAPGATEPPTEVEERQAHGELRPCVNGPGGPRQTEDPQSPPCKQEIFRGDNGGATWRGVTATQIRIGYPLYGNSPYGSNDDNEKLFPAWVDHFNEHYEFHGRSLEFVPVDVTARSADPAVHRADARAFAEAEVFAALAYPRFGAHQTELAQLGIVHTIDSYRGGMPTSQQLDALAPHGWAVYPTLDENVAAVGELVCRSLAGRPAQHGGDDVADRQRRFGVVVQQPGKYGLVYDDRPLAARLEACGADHRRYPVDHGNVDADLLMRRLRDDGITTVVCVCDDLERDYTAAAETVGFRPEWVLPGIDDYQIRLKDRRIKPDEHPRQQMDHVFGLWSGPRRPPAEGVGRRYRADDEYWFRAAKDQDPTVREPSNEYPYGWYAQLLALASGIQWAGADLTPETFAAALESLTFPNPLVGGPPWHQASVGFGAGDHAFLSDYALFWWSDPSGGEGERNPEMGQVCYVGGGARFTAETIPADADGLFFDPEAGCR